MDEAIGFVIHSSALSLTVCQAFGSSVCQSWLVPKPLTAFSDFSLNELKDSKQFFLKQHAGVGRLWLSNTDSLVVSQAVIFDLARVGLGICSSKQLG